MASAVVHEGSAECISSGLELFSIPGFQASVQKIEECEFYPIAPISEAAVIDILIPASSDNYLDLSSISLRLKCKITRANGGSLIATDVVAPINYLLNSAFTQVDVYLGTTLVSESAHGYGYRAYLDTLLQYGQEARRGHLKTAGYFQDTTPFDGCDTVQNKGCKERFELFELSKTVELMGKISADVFQVERYLVPGVDVKLRFVRQPHSFCLMTAPPAQGAQANAQHNYKLEFESFTVHGKRIFVSDQMALAHHDLMVKQNIPARYPLQRTQVKRFVVPAGGTSIIQDQLWSGFNPKFVITGLVSTAAFAGHYNKNPFNFHHFNLQAACLHVGGTPIPARPFTFSFAPNREEFARAYYSVLDIVNGGSPYEDKGRFVSSSEYSKGFTLLGFALKPIGVTERDCYNPTDVGSARMELTFTEGLPESLTVICYCVYESMMEIDGLRNITVT